MTTRNESFVVVLVTALVVAGCGSGGGGGGAGSPPPPAPTTSANASAVAAANVLAGVTRATDAMAGGTDPSGPAVATAGFSAARKSDLGAAVTRLTQRLSRGFSGALATPAVVSSCGVSGTQDYTEVVTPSETTATWAFNECLDIFGPKTTYRHGTMTIVTTPGGTTEYHSNIVFRTTRTADNRLLDETVWTNSVMTFSNATPTLCGTVTVYTDYDYTARGSYTERVDADGDGTFEVDGAGTLDNYRVRGSGLQYDTACEVTAASLTQRGAFSYSDNLDVRNSFSLSMPDADPLVVVWTSDVSGTTLEVNGSVTMNCACFTGSITYATLTPIFTPAGSTPPCATSGVVRLTGSLTATVTYTSTGGVQIDNGSDGTVDLAYASCTEAKTCR